MTKPLFHLPLLSSYPTAEESGLRLNAESEGKRPTKRGDCLEGGPNTQRPCRWRTCKYHLGSTSASCVLDVADQGGATAEEVAEALNWSTAKARQVELDALFKLKKHRAIFELD